MSNRDRKNKIQKINIMFLLHLNKWILKRNNMETKKKAIYKNDYSYRDIEF